MNYPLISEYIESIKSAEDNFEELSYLRPVLGDDGLPVMTSGNFAVVFKMKEEQSDKYYAVKCFTKEQEGRAEAYREIAKELGNVSSPYLTSVRYLDKELFVDTDQTAETEFPVLLMDWMEGKMLDKYLRENLDDNYALEMLAYRFSQFAQWLIPQPFAHGDLKPDNIIVRDDGALVLVDYDGMFVPAMRGQKARELGSPDFRHPLRTENEFDARIDDFPIMSILISLIGISKSPNLLSRYGAPDRLLFSKADYVNIEQRNIIKDLLLIDDENLRTLTCIFASLCHQIFPITIQSLEKPVKKGTVEGYFLPGAELLGKFLIQEPKFPLSMEKVLEGLMQLNDLMSANGIDYVLTGSLGLYVHGMVPASYIPHDIDIIISNNKNKHPHLTNQMILDLFSQHSGGYRPGYEYIDASNMFVFYIGINNVEINAFVDLNNVFVNSDFCVMNILGHEIKVNNALSIFKEKYKMRRLKDFKFNNEIQSSLNSFLVPKQVDFEEIYSRMILTDKVRDFFNGITFLFDHTETEVFTIIFDDDIKKIWLPEHLWEKCIVKVTSWEGSSKKNDSIIFGIKGEFTKICRLDSSKIIQGCLKHDFSYMVDFVYYILYEMKIVDFFGEHINELVKVVNDYKSPVVYYDDDDFPF